MGNIFRYILVLKYVLLVSGTGFIKHHIGKVLYGENNITKIIWRRTVIFF